jgi:hypothetical protein
MPTTQTVHVTIGLNSHANKETVINWFKMYQGIHFERQEESNFIATNPMSHHLALETAARTLAKMEEWNVYSVRIEK